MMFGDMYCKSATCVYDKEQKLYNVRKVKFYINSQGGHASSLRCQISDLINVSMCLNPWQISNHFTSKTAT